METAERSQTSRFGAVAAGHPATVDAAAEVLAAGGNAYDAIIAGMAMASVAEPVLCSLGGGGFLLARPIGKDARLYDFFMQTPRRRPVTDALDFYPVLADFGTTTQEFHIGRGAMATPGAVAGLFAIHQDLGRIPLRELLAPAAALARDGLTMTEFQSYLFSVVAPIYLAQPESRAIFGSVDDPASLLRPGEVMRNRDLAESLDALAREGPKLFYEGDMARCLVDDCRTGGGTLTMDDLAAYRVERRVPLSTEYRGHQLQTNPAPSVGGLLIAVALGLMAADDIAARSLSAEHMARLASAMASADAARGEAGSDIGNATTARRMLSAAALERFRAVRAAHPLARRGTTHISVIDGAGNAAAMTVSNGEGCGYIIPGSGIMMNNVLGEEDINPAGFHRWPEDTRMASMMAPTLLTDGAGVTTVLGSGGSNRIRTAILQAIVNLVDFRMDVADAVDHPRIHLEGGRLSVEPGYDAAAVETLRAIVGEVQAWQQLNVFFGGVHAVRHEPTNGTFTAAGDPRRGGVARVV